MTNENFAGWLQRKISDLNMSQADLARESGLSTAAISLILNRGRGVGPDACSALAGALRLPTETVFREAGLLPQLSSDTKKREVIVGLYEQLPQEDQDELLSYVDFLLQRSRKKRGAKSSG